MKDKISYKQQKLVNKCLKKHGINISCSNYGILFNCCYKWNSDDKYKNNIMMCPEFESEKAINDMIDEINSILKETNFKCYTYVIQDGCPFSKYSIIIQNKDYQKSYEQITWA